MDLHEEYQQLCQTGFAYADGHHVRCVGKVDDPQPDRVTITAGYFWDTRFKTWNVYIMSPCRPIFIRQTHVNTEEEAIEKLLEYTETYGHRYK